MTKPRKSINKGAGSMKRAGALLIAASVALTGLFSATAPVHAKVTTGASSQVSAGAPVNPSFAR